jgi:molybdopterin converting factor small subunit
MAANLATMAKIKVKYLNVYYRVTRKQEEFIEFDGRLTLGEALTIACRRYGPKLKDLILDEESKLKPHAWMLVNQEREKDLQRELMDGEVVVFSLPIVGG